jgi:glycosyltransferase involved in cell wall biosynthesis
VKILQVTTSDRSGGAERSASNLARAFRERGHDSWLAVGFKRDEVPETLELPRDAGRNAVVRFVDSLRREHEDKIRRIRGAGRALSALRFLAEPARSVEVALGREDFAYPGAKELLRLAPERPDVVHVHNLHGGYFDLRTLPQLSSTVPTILNVRDGWLMSGHCAFSLGCDRWKSGCGECPDLSLFPSIPRDATSFNWERKRRILAASRLFVTTASQWMMDRVRESIVAGGVAETRVIPNGVDTKVFFPADRELARDQIGVERGAFVLLVAANGLRRNVWKDYETLRAALGKLGTRTWQRPVLVLAVGEDGAEEQVGELRLRFVPFLSDSNRLATYYRAADVYLHAARVESFGNVLLEARACGTPVVATAVGGIPEQVRGLGGPWTEPTRKAHELRDATGILVAQGDAEAFAAAISLLLEDEAVRHLLGRNGQQQVGLEYTLDVQAERFLAWYQEIVQRAAAEGRPS